MRFFWDADGEEKRKAEATRESSHPNFPIRMQQPAFANPAFEPDEVQATTADAAVLQTRALSGSHAVASASAQPASGFTRGGETYRARISQLNAATGTLKRSLSESFEPWSLTVFPSEI